MPVVWIPALLRDLTGGQQTVTLPGATVGQVIDELERRHPGLASYLVDETGRLRRHVNVFVGEEPVRDRAALSDRLGPDARVFILQALSGG